MERGDNQGGGVEQRRGDQGRGGEGELRGDLCDEEWEADGRGQAGSTLAGVQPSVRVGRALRPVLAQIGGEY